MGVSASDDGKLFATVSEGGEGRVFDVVNFGMFLCNPFAVTILNIFATARHDKYPQVPIYPQGMLLGPRARGWAAIVGGFRCR